MTILAETTVLVLIAATVGSTPPTKEINPQMRKRKKKAAQPKVELVNIYGRKPSQIVAKHPDGHGDRFLGEFPSRRQARKHRAKVCEDFKLQTYETRIIPYGAQLPH